MTTDHPQGRAQSSRNGGLLKREKKEERAVKGKMSSVLQSEVMSDIQVEILSKQVFLSSGRDHGAY